MFYNLNNEYFVRSLDYNDVNEKYISWFEDQQVCKFSSHGKFQKNKNFFLDYVSETNKNDRLVWALCHENHGHIGNLALQCISQINRSAEFAIIIGDRRHWGKSVGFLAGLALLYHGFYKLNLNRIYCGTAFDNHAMNSLAIRLGMKLEGKRRNALFLSGTYVDVIEYGILCDEFYESGIQIFNDVITRYNV